mgnify:CR=1 FL=1
MNDRLNSLERRLERERSARKQAEQLLADARQQATSMLDQARQEAAEILQHARKEVDRVRTAGEEALRLLQQPDPVEIDLLISDVIMPGIGGKDLSERLLALYPDLKVLFMSGYPDETVVHHCVLDEGVAYLKVDRDRFDDRALDEFVARPA